MARELSMNGNTKLKTIKQEFNDRFPYIRLSIYAQTEREKDAKAPLNGDKTIAEVRTVKSSEPATIRGGQKVRNLEKMIDEIFGLYCQVAYTDKDNNRYHTTGSYDEMSLRELNELGEQQGWKKGVWE
jgi:hypothetical protein